jgi:hypothetical protein
MRRAKKLWIGGAVVALAHNITAEDGDTLSEAMDDWIFAHRGGAAAAGCGGCSTRMTV